MIIGKVADVDPKMGKDRDGKPSNTPWLVKFKFVTDSQSLWLGAHTQKPNAPKAFAAKIVEERDLADGQKTLWELDYEEVTEGIYTNYYVTSARSVTSDTPTVSTPAPALQQGSKDDAIARAVAFKGAIDVLVKKVGASAASLPEEAYVGDIIWDDILKCIDAVSKLTDAFEAILQRRYSQESTEDPQPIEADEGGDLFEEAPL